MRPAVVAEYCPLVSAVGDGLSACCQDLRSAFTTAAILLSKVTTIASFASTASSIFFSSSVVVTFVTIVAVSTTFSIARNGVVVICPAASTKFTIAFHNLSTAF